MSYNEDSIWTLPRIIITVVVGFVILFAVAFFSAGSDFAIYKFWAPKRANVEREVFTNTNSYIQGKTDNLSRLRFEFQSTKDDGQKAALRTLILSEASNVDTTKLPADLQGFIAGLKENADD